MVHSEWLPLPGSRSPDRIAVSYPDQHTAEHAALRTACCAGARYISVEGPDSLVTLDWDRYTNVARRFTRYLGPCGNEREPDGEVCPGELYARPGDQAMKCPTCGGWTGVRAPSRARYHAAGQDRHLVLSGAGAGLVVVACAQPAVAVPYDRTQHTYLTMLTTCTACRMVHDAWQVAFVASLG